MAVLWHPPRVLRFWLIVTWGAGGVAVFLAAAVSRLIGYALDSLPHATSPIHWAAYALSIAFIGYTEGYRAFQLRYSPRVVARAMHAAASASVWLWALAPVFCMGFFGATRRLLTVSWGVLIGVVGIVLLVGLLDQPWRGIVDAGVVVGLGWGVVTIGIYFARAVAGRPPAVDAGVPEGWRR